MNMIYNGMEFPALPTPQPYENAVIHTTGSDVYLVFFEDPRSFELEYSGFLGATSWSRYILSDDTKEWLFVDSLGEVYGAHVKELIWSSYDVFVAEDGSLYLEGSAPLSIFAAAHTIHADLLQRGVRPRIDAMQGDSMTRRIEFVLTAGGVPWTPPEGTTAALSYIRPDGVGRVYEKLEDGAEAYTICGNIIRMTLLPEVLQIAGDVMAVLQISRRNDGKLISTFPVEIAVEAEPSYNVHPGGCTSWEPVSVTAVKDGNEITVTAVYATGKTETSVIALDDAGNPVSVIKNDITIALHWEGFA